MPANYRSCFCATAAMALLLAACGGGDTGLPLAQADSAVAAEQPLDASEDTRAHALAAAPRSSNSVNAPGRTGTALVVRARGTLAGGTGPLMQVRVNGVLVGSLEVRDTEYQDYSFSMSALNAGSMVDVVFTNDAIINGQDRNLYVSYVQGGGSVVLPVAPGVLYDRGSGAAAFDGLDTSAGQEGLFSSGALRFTWPASSTPSNWPEQVAASRFLQQASFGATQPLINKVVSLGEAAWLTEQMALPYGADFVAHVQTKFDLGVDYRPNGSKYSGEWVAERFWAMAATGTDQLRRRVAFSLHQMLLVSFTDSNQWHQSRAYAAYLDVLHRHAFGNFRNLLEDIALSPSMGIYLSHLRNQKEDPATGRLPDENFARELMQLFTIGLHELNLDGSAKLDAAGKPIETYNNQDVMALAKVFTGYSWALPDNQLNHVYFLWGNPDFSVGNGQGIDVQRMKAYPSEASSAEKRLFTGKPQAVTIAAYASPADNLRIALDTLFKHPNVGPFVGRQLIQRLVTSAPSPAYVARVASAFNDNGKAVRGDLAAVVRAVLLDAEARSATPAAGFGKLREPVLRVTQWMRAFSAVSSSGAFLMSGELAELSQRALFAPSVFNYYRPGYVPPNSVFSARGATAPEFQIVDESTTANWVNLAEQMSGNGVGLYGNPRDVNSQYSTLAGLAASGKLSAMLDHLNLLLFAGTMSPNLRQALSEAIAGVSGSDAASHLYRARMAVFVALASSEFVVQR